MNHYYSKFFFFFFLLFVTAVGAQTTEQKRIIYRDNHIKRILTYCNDTSEDSRYLNTISILNDSGLVVKELWLRRNGDTINSYISQYDNHNRTISCLVYGNNPSIATYDYPKKASIRTTLNVGDKTTTTYRRYINFKIKGRILSFYFLNGQFKSICRVKKKESYTRYYTRNFNKLKTSLRKTVEYLDNDKNIIRETTASKYKIKMVVGGYTQTETATGITEDHTIKKKVAQRSEFESAYEYNALKLLSKITSYPPIQTGNANAINSHCSYTFFEYKTE